MDSISLAGKRILLTRANQFMGPALAKVLSELGAEVIADEDRLEDSCAPSGIGAIVWN